MARSSAQFAVRCRSIGKSYGAGATTVTALRGVDLDVRRGELMMIVGPSGCGKTSLISIIAAILDQDSGDCEVLGQDLRHLGSTERAHFRSASLGFVFQLFNLIPQLTALENVTVPILINDSNRKRAEVRAEELLAMVGLADRCYARPRELSGGQQQRVSIARALACNPELVICDEPTSSLDHETGRDVMAMLRRYARTPERAVIVVTHDPRIMDFADRIARMDDGRIVEIGSGEGRDNV